MKKIKTKTALLMAWLLSVLTGLFKLFQDGLYKVDTYSTTLYAFSYQKYGFNSRMLLGSVFKALCDVFPKLETYQGCFWFMLVIALIMALSFYLFGYYLIRKAKRSGSGNYRDILIIYCLMMGVVIPSHLAGQNFGKPDALIFAFTLLQAYLILEEKRLWAVPVLSLFQVIVHEGYLCMTACVAICMLLCKVLTVSKEQKQKWMLIFALNLVLIAIPTAYFLFFKTSFDLDVWNEAFEMAKRLNVNNNAHVEIIDLELNISNPNYSMVTSASTLKANAIKETLPFLALFSPILVILSKPLVKMLHIKEPRVLKIITFILGISLIAVEFVMYCDFGRYTTWIIMFIALLECYLLIQIEEYKYCDIYKPGAAQFILPVLLIVLLTPIQSSYYTSLSHYILTIIF